jgi:hypothetical protein
MRGRRALTAGLSAVLLGGGVLPITASPALAAGSIPLTALDTPTRRTSTTLSPFASYPTASRPAPPGASGPPRSRSVARRRRVSGLLAWLDVGSVTKRETWEGVR